MKLHRVMVEVLVNADSPESARELVGEEIDYLLRCETPLAGFNTLAAKEYNDDEDSEFLTHPVRAAIRYNYGDKCEEYHPDCVVCHAWKAYEECCK